MRKWIAVALVGPMIAGAAVTMSLAQGSKIGFVDTLAVLYATEEGKRELEGLNQFASVKQQEVALLTSEVQILQDRYVSQQAVLNPTARVDMERDIGDKERNLQRLQEDVELEYNQRSEALLARMGEKIQGVIVQYSQDNGYSVIFMRNETQSFVDVSLDVTEEIIRIYNESNPVTGQAGSQ